MLLRNNHFADSNLYKTVSILNNILNLINKYNLTYYYVKLLLVVNHFVEKQGSKTSGELQDYEINNYRVLTIPRCHKYRKQRGIENQYRSSLNIF